MARLGKVRRGAARLGEAWLGRAGHGSAGQGKAGLIKKGKDLMEPMMTHQEALKIIFNDMKAQKAYIQNELKRYWYNPKIRELHDQLIWQLDEMMEFIEKTL